MHELLNKYSNTINITPTVFLSCNTPVCPNYDTYLSLLSEGNDSLEHFFDTQFRNLTLMSPLNTVVREQPLPTSLIY